MSAAMGSWAGRLWASFWALVGGFLALAVAVGPRRGDIRQVGNEAVSGRRGQQFVHAEAAEVRR